MSARPVRAFAVALLAALLGALLPATAARAGTVQGGRLDWGVKSSFQSYVTGPVAKGGFKLKGGAATVGGSLFRFHSATGSYDPASGAFEASYSGGVTFQGHQKPDGVHELDMTVSRPTVRISAGEGHSVRGRLQQGEGHRRGQQPVPGALRHPRPRRRRHEGRREPAHPHQPPGHPH